MPKQPNTPEDGARRSTMRQLAEYSQIGFVLPTAIVAGWLVGLGLDHWLHTHWLYLAGVILGSVAGFVDLIRTLLKPEKPPKDDSP